MSFGDNKITCARRAWGNKTRLVNIWQNTTSSGGNGVAITFQELGHSETY